MADQDTPAGGRPGRPFVPPFRGPSSADGAGAGGERTATPERAQPRPFMPPGSGGPVSPAAPALPLAPTPPAHPTRPSPPNPPPVAASGRSEPDSKLGAAAAPIAPRPKSPVLAEAVLSELADGSRDLAHELAEELAEELAVEHAISETIGQGGATAASDSLVLERASEESPDALPGLSALAESAGLPEMPSLPALPGLADPAEPSDDDVPSGGPELSFFLPPDEADTGLREPRRSPTEGATPERETPGSAWAPTQTSGAEAREDTQGEDSPSSSTPLPWLSAPTPGAEPEGTAAPRALDEAPSGSVEEAISYDARPKRYDTPARSLAESSAGDSATMIGANLVVVEALERVARRIRSGELRVPAVDESAGEAGALASALAVLLGVRS